MPIKLNPIRPEKGKAFADDKFNRFNHAFTLSTIIQANSSGFVLAINNKWGVGKTTFVKMLERHLNDQEFTTIYFNAWENDFDDSPFTAIMAEIKQGLEIKETLLFKKVLKAAATLSKNLLPTILKSIAEKYIHSKTISDSLEQFAKGTGQVFEEEIKVYVSKKENLITFKKTLETFLEKEILKKPIVFIIDELDRCRPNYAVSILEQIKHFFSINNIVFILSIDKDQLCHAIKGVYGNDNFDASEYLKRFIDIEYTLPEPDTTNYIEYLFEYFEYEKIFELINKGDNNFKGAFRNEYKKISIALLSE